MTNREAYKDYLNGYSWDNFCGFKQTTVFRDLGIKSCVHIGPGDVCIACSALFEYWLDMECEEPEVDWDNVPVDTLVRVRDNDNEEWVLQYFKGIDKNRENLEYMAWSYGATSATAQGNSVHWQYCELVEEEDDGSN